MDLAALQRSFQARVLNGALDIEAHLLPVEADERARRTAIYADGYLARLIEALATTYPALSHTLGEESFARLIRAFVASSPSTFYSVRHYGAQLASHIEVGATGAREQGLAELARFEWLIAEVFDAADDAPAPAQALTAVAPTAWGGVTFTFRASLRRFTSVSNAIDWWRAAQGLREPPGQFLVGAPALEWLLWRADLSPQFRSLARPEALALDAARHGASFAAVCEALAEEVGPEAAPLEAASLLRGWFANELITAIATPTAAQA